MRLRQFFSMPSLLVVVVFLPCAILATPTARAQTFTVLHSFGGGAGGKFPYGSLIRDASGNLYGTTSEGGYVSPDNPGYGMVFELASPGKETALYSFKGGADGSYPLAGLIFDGAGNLYGTTSGSPHEVKNTPPYGTVFKLTPSGGVWTESVLYGFQGFPGDGGYPTADLVMDAAGDLYGTTVKGGRGDWGTVFEVDPSGAETVLYDYEGTGTITLPQGGLIVDASGDIYGANGFFWTSTAARWHVGSAFELTPSDSSWTETGLYDFQSDFGSAPNGSTPAAGVVMDATGSLYGTTYAGGAFNYGTVFKLTPDGEGWTESVLYSFKGGADGSYPWAGLVMDTAGNLYGTTSEGGGSGNNGDGYGTVFKLDSTGKETILHSFTGGTDGGSPGYGVLVRAAGNLYGTTVHGGNPSCNASFGCGVVFKLTP